MKRVKRSKISWSQPLFHAYLEEGTAIFFSAVGIKVPEVLSAKKPSPHYWLGLMASPRLMGALCRVTGAELFLSPPQEEP